jgi:small subunit ribosomal protein S2
MVQPVVTMKELLEAGVHFGHQTRRWNPKMKPYIFTERNDIYIIDLQKTLVMIGTAFNAMRNSVANGGTILLVGTKKQAQEAVDEHAARCDMPFVNQRWLGGTLTNFSTIHSRIMYMDELERRDREGELERLSKKEALQVRRQIDKLRRNLEGIRNMHSLPSMIRKLGIPIVGLVDTNCDPEEVDYVIPGNDDAIRAANLLCRIVADAALEGQGMRDAKLAEEIAEQAASAREKLEHAPVRVGGAVPAYSASPEDIGGPDLTAEFSGDKSEELAAEAVAEAVDEAAELEPGGTSPAASLPEGE